MEDWQLGASCMRRLNTNISRFLFAERYLDQLKHAKVKGHLFQQQNYVPK